MNTTQIVILSAWLWTNMKYPGPLHAILVLFMTEFMSPSTTFAVSTGYFIYELVHAIRSRKLDSIVHGFVCSVAYMFLLKHPEYNDVGTAYLRLELSTPLFHAWKIARRNRQNELFFLTLFRIAFAFIRVIYLGALTILVWSMPVHIFLKHLASSFYALNIAWYIGLNRITVH